MIIDLTSLTTRKYCTCAFAILKKMVTQHGKMTKIIDIVEKCVLKRIDFILVVFTTLTKIHINLVA